MRSLSREGKMIVWLRPDCANGNGPSEAEVGREMSKFRKSERCPCENRPSLGARAFLRAAKDDSSGVMCPCEKLASWRLRGVNSLNYFPAGSYDG